MKQIPLPIGVEPARTFDNFLPGANEQAISQLRALGARSNPVYLWGTSGSGKTHLLRATAQQFHDQGLQVGWFSAADLPPWPHDEAWSLIVFDDCDDLDPDQQHAAFALFVEAVDAGVPVVAAGRVPPVDLPLRESETRAALRREADRRGVFLSDEVMDYLLTRYARDLKHLMAQVDRLDEFSLATKRAITVPLLKQMLSEAGG